MNTIDNKPCLACGKIVKGRSDKKFCNDSCRNNFNNQAKSDVTNYVRNTNNALRKNRKILEELLQGSGKETYVVGKTKLIEMGFVPKYFTNMYTTQKGVHYFFVYEYGYQKLEDEKVMIVKDKKAV